MKPETDQTSAPNVAAGRPGLPLLVIGLTFVLGCRLLLYAWMPDRTTDFDFLYEAAARLVRGENPYPPATQWFPYPLPAVLLAVPFTAIPLGLARSIFDVLVGWAFVYALWRYRRSYALLALMSGAYLFAMANGQTTPLMVAATLVPALGFLLAVKPNTSASLWIAWPSLRALVGVGVFLLLSLVVLPSWPVDWWMALPLDNTQLMPPFLRPFGFVLLLAAIRWRSPEGRLLLATAFIPQSTLPYELVPLALIPANRLEMGIYVAGSWIAMAAAGGLQLSQSMAEWTATGWVVTLCAVYLPMLYLVLRRQRSRSGRKIEKDRRRPNRLADHELKVEVTPDGAGGFMVKVTHLPTKLFTTESGQTRELAVRKAQDKLAGILAADARSVRRSGEAS
ncbi:MAG TPA: hypothetical protein VFY42_06210 [Gemmatimonadales bacterium]|nr:hypothetical protein [Gemmatimonadales bacterium]